MAYAAKRSKTRCPTHPGALLRDDIIPATGRTKAEIAGLLGRPDLLRIGARPDRPGEAPAMLADVTRLRREVGFDAETTRAQQLRDLVGSRPG